MIKKKNYMLVVFKKEGENCLTVQIPDISAYGIQF